jgi:hypothetical protein
MGEGRPKTVDVIAMPAVVAVATTRSRKTMPAHEGGGSSLPPLPSQPQQWQQVHFFGSNQMMLMSTPPRRQSRDKRMASQGGLGGDVRRINDVVTVSHRSIQAANGDAEPPTYHHGLLPLDPFCAFTTFSLAIKQRGLEEQPLLVLLSSYVHFYVSVLHLSLIDFVHES